LSGMASGFFRHLRHASFVIDQTVDEHGVTLALGELHPLVHSLGLAIAAGPHADNVRIAVEPEAFLAADITDRDRTKSCDANDGVAYSTFHPRCLSGR
jgi:hypothetical protein